MTTNDQDNEQWRLAVVAACGTVADAFRVKATDTLATAWLWGLAGLTIKQIHVAAAAAIRTKKFFPSVAELRELTGETTPDQAAELAWVEFLDAAKLGPYRHVDFADRAINATVRSLGGWVNALGRFSGADEERFLKRDFIAAYKIWSARDCSGESGAPLQGLSEGAMRHGKFLPAAPVRIAQGDRQSLIGAVVAPKKQEMPRLTRGRYAR